MATAAPTNRLEGAKPAPTAEKPSAGASAPAASAAAAPATGGFKAFLPLIANLVLKRGDGIDGRRLQSAIKQTLPAGTRLRVLEVDFLGRDDASSARNPVLWAKVEVLTD